jgi:hypothetical protein
VERSRTVAHFTADHRLVDRRSVDPWASGAAELVSRHYPAEVDGVDAEVGKVVLGVIDSLLMLAFRSMSPFFRNASSPPLSPIQ